MSFFVNFVMFLSLIFVYDCVYCLLKLSPCLGQQELVTVNLLPPATKLGQGYVFTGVCDSVHRGVVCLSACWDATPQSRHPPGTRYIPQEQTPCWTRYPPKQTPPPWDQVHPLRADTPREDTPQDQVHPPGSRHPPPVQSMLEDTVNAREVRILLECNLVIYKLSYFFKRIYQPTWEDMYTLDLEKDKNLPQQFYLLWTWIMRKCNKVLTCPFSLSTFLKHLLSDKLCRTEFFQPVGAFWKYGKWVNIQL